MKAQQIFESAVNMQLTGDLEGAKTAYKKLLRAYPNSSEVLGNLAVIVKKDGQIAVAENMLQRAVRANPQNFSALTTLANIRLADKDFDAARRYNDAALAIEPHFPDAIVNNGVLLIRDNQITKAEDAFHRAMQLDPRNANAKINLAKCACLRKENLEGSIQMLKASLEHLPDNAGLHIMLSYTYQETMQYSKGLESARQADRFMPDQIEYLTAIANALIVLGEFEEGMEYYRRAIAMDPDNTHIEGSYLFALNYDDRKTPLEVFKQYEAFGRRLAKGKKKYTHDQRPRIENRKIRIGYASPDFHSHVVTFFIEPILRNHDKEQFEVFAYANVAKPDQHTEHLKKYFDHWVDVLEMSDEDMARRVKEDDIDILIDLAGHTADNRLAAFASRPAPIQVTYLGYGYTTGMEEIDYFIGDENFTPEGCDSVFSEEIVRIPAPVFAYNPPRIQIPEVQELPALKKGYVTFGTMSRLVRLNERMLKVWKRVLDRVPGSKLRIDQKPFDEQETVERFHRRLEKLGYTRDQVEIVSTRPHWAGYHEIDIALDCWPHNTGTTIFDSIFSGVPVISKRDRPSVGRLSAMALVPMGFGDWLADDEDGFVEKAVALASDLPALAELRASLRERMEQSPFFDFKGRTRGLESGYLEMVRRYNEERA